MADSAMRLLALQAVANLGGGGDVGRGRSGGHDKFEEYAYGLVGGGDGGAPGDGEIGGEGGAVRGGSASLMKVQAAIRRDPGRWVEAYNAFLRRELGAEELGAGGSAA